MEELQAIDFAIVDLNLYLDTHPNDANAVNEYNRYAQESKKLRQKIESIYGPLQNFGNSFVGFPWNWDEPPWPWQM
ncbi:MAG TPA: spore coat protein CotJB [Bacillales bacterium]|nr:spore coat protein CotJB [Bacillales bacterium]